MSEPVIVHGEMYDGEMFCGEFERADGSVQRVWRSEWSHEPEQIQRVPARDAC